MEHWAQLYELWSSQIKAGADLPFQQEFFVNFYQSVISQQLFKAAIHAKRTKRCRDENRHDCHRKYDLPAGQSHRHRNRTDRGLHSCLRQVSNHAEQTLLPVQRCLYQTEQHAHGTEKQGNCDHNNRRQSSSHSITDIHRRTHHHKQKYLCCKPQLSKLFRQTCRHLFDTAQFQHAGHADHSQKPGHRNEWL